MATPILELLDAAAAERVVVFGTPPPEGRDLDLLVHEGARAALAGVLDAEGFTRSGETWARFADCGVEAVDLVPVAGWGLPASAVAALYRDSVPLPGLERIARPAPAHAILIETRRFARGRGGLGEKARRRIDRALAEDSRAFEGARRGAGAWGVLAALVSLERVYAGDEPVRVRRGVGGAIRALARIRRGTVVAFSGLDGAGKSTQAQSLAETLDALGVACDVVWSPLGQSAVLDLVGRPAKRAVSLLRFGRFRAVAERSRTGSLMTVRQEGPSEGAGIVRQLWATFVALVNAFEQRTAVSRALLAGSVVVLDRQALDAVVRMRFLYGDAAALPLQRALIRLVAPKPRFAYYLAIRPETSLARKSDHWDESALRSHAGLYEQEAAGFDVRRVDGERPTDQICAEVALEVWLGVST